MSKFLRKFECKICENTLKSPVFLPCGHSICNKHSTDCTEIYCKQCKKSYSKPYNGFALNLNSNMFLNCWFQIEALHERFRSIKQKPEDFIGDFFSNLKNKIDIKREELKIYLENYSSQLTCDLELIENDLSENNPDQVLSSFQKFLEDPNFNLEYFVSEKCSIPLLKEIILEQNENYKLRLDQLYIELIENFDLLQLNCIKDLKNKVRIFQEMSEKMENFKQHLDILAESCEIYHWKNTIYELNLFKDNFKKDILNLKNQILMGKGHECELEQFNYPEIEFFKNRFKFILKMNF